jgi:hypothetical protein
MHHPHDRRRAVVLIGIFLPLLFAAVEIMPMRRAVERLIAQALPQEPAWLQEYEIELMKVTPTPSAPTPSTLTPSRSTPSRFTTNPLYEEDMPVDFSNEKRYCYRIDGSVTHQRSECAEDQSKWLRVARRIPPTMEPNTLEEFERAMTKAYGGSTAHTQNSIAGFRPFEVAQAVRAALEALLTDPAWDADVRHRLYAVSTEFLTLSERTDLTHEDLQPVLLNLQTLLVEIRMVQPENGANTKQMNDVLTRAETLLTDGIPTGLALLKQRNVDVTAVEEQLAIVVPSFASLASGCGGGSAHACSEVVEILVSLHTETEALREELRQQLSAETFAVTIEELEIAATAHGVAE